MWNTFTHNLNICVWVCFWCPKLKMRKNIVMAHSYEFFSALLTCGGEAGDRSSSALPLGHRDVCGPPAWSILAKFFYLPYLGCFQLHLESCIRVHSFEDCGGGLSAYPREIRNREGAAQRRSSPILLSRSYFSRENPPPLFRSSSSSSSSFFRKTLSGFRQSRGPIEQRESRGCSGAHFTFFTVQVNKWYPRREQVDSFTDTVFQQTTTETNPQ